MDAGELAVTEDAGIGIVEGQGFEQLVEGVLLGFGASVGRLAVGIETALIDNTEGAVVVALDMNTLDTLGEQGDDAAIVTDVVVVRDLTETLEASADKALDTEGTGTLVGYAVDDEVLD